MVKLYNINKVAVKLVTSAGALALMAGLNPALVQTATANECLLENNTTGGANSNGTNNTLACGSNSEATATSSTAIGFDTSATGAGSTAMGVSAKATNGNSTAVGVASRAIGVRSTALGTSAKATHVNSTAVGVDANATSSNSTAVGRFAKATASVTTALGSGAEATASGTTALGSGANAAATSSTAVGIAADATGENSTAVGGSSRAAGYRSIALGGDNPDSTSFPSGTQALGKNSIVIGTSADDNGFDDAIVIGFGANALEDGQIILGSADTFTILSNGNVGFGSDSPADPLDIHGYAPAIRLTETDYRSGAPVQAKLNNGIFSLSFVGDNETEFQMDTNGNVTLQGELITSGPTCSHGCDAVFDAKYNLPSIEEHAKSMFADKHLPAVGPTKPKAAINVSERMGTMLNELEKAHIYIAQQQTEIEEMKAQIAFLMSK